MPKTCLLLSPKGVPCQLRLPQRKQLKALGCPHLPSVGADDANVTLLDSALALGVCEEALQQLQQGYSLLCIEEAWGVSFPPLEGAAAKLGQGAYLAGGHAPSAGGRFAFRML